MYQKKNHSYHFVKSLNLKKKKVKGIRLLLALRQFSVAHCALWHCLKRDTLLDLY